MTVYNLKFYCPDLGSQSDIVLLREALAQSPGIDVVDVDLQSQTVLVTTASQDAGADVRHRLSEAGFPAED